MQLKRKSSCIFGWNFFSFHTQFYVFQLVGVYCCIVFCFCINAYKNSSQPQQQQQQQHHFDKCINAHAAKYYLLERFIFANNQRRCCLIKSYRIFFVYSCIKQAKSVRGTKTMHQIVNKCSHAKYLSHFFRSLGELRSKVKYCAINWSSFMHATR